MQHVLDIDLDFFVHGAAHWRGPDAGRLDEAEYPPWSVAEALDFIRDRCGLDERLPGFVVEHHCELFGCWRDAIDEETLEVPFRLTHVDAHADLGLGDAGYVHLLTSFVHREPRDRRDPGRDLADGNFLAFAIACRWISDLTYVFSDGGGDDVLSYVMEGFDPKASHIQIPELTRPQMDQLLYRLEKPSPVRLEPRVPFRSTPWRDYRANGSFDVICLARSPSFTPAGSDAIFDVIRERFIDEAALLT